MELQKCERVKEGVCHRINYSLKVMLIIRQLPYEM